MNIILIKKNVVIFFLLISSVILPDDVKAEDWLIGSWSHGYNCDRPDFMFQNKKALINGDADGQLFTLIFHNVKFFYKDNFALVDFARAHGFSGAKSDHEILFYKNQDGSIKMDRKIRDRDISSVLVKCK